MDRSCGSDGWRRWPSVEPHHRHPARRDRRVCPYGQEVGCYLSVHRWPRIGERRKMPKDDNSKAYEFAVKIMNTGKQAAHDYTKAKVDAARELEGVQQAALYWMLSSQRRARSRLLRLDSPCCWLDGFCTRRAISQTVPGLRAAGGLRPRRPDPAMVPPWGAPPGRDLVIAESASAAVGQEAKRLRGKAIGVAPPLPRE
jgi:hypothetical protein